MVDQVVYYSDIRNLYKWDINSNIHVLIKDGFHFLAGITLDKINQKIYALDYISDKIWVMNIDGSNPSIFKICNGPSNLTIDYNQNEIYYIAQDEFSIRKCNMDGSDDIVFYQSEYDGLFDIAINNNDGKIYWTHWGEKRLKSAYPSGEDLIEIGNENIYHGLSIDANFDFAYASDYTDIRRINIADGSSQSLSIPNPNYKYINFGFNGDNNFGCNNCTTKVKNTRDYAYSSLRNALNCANSGDTITVEKLLSGDTIELEEPISISDSFLIVNTYDQPLCIKSMHNNNLIEVQSGGYLYLSNLGFVAPNNSNEGKVLNVQGTLETHDIKIYHESHLSPSSLISISGKMKVSGSLVIIKL